MRRKCNVGGNPTCEFGNEMEDPRPRCQIDENTLCDGRGDGDGGKGADDGGDG